ncbi:MAG: PIN domain-containing protein [Acidobacteria bacterium]|nr:PIN domain-containing protein [Acidobacteriota bacterium]
MKPRIFADTLYWVAILNPKDQWHRPAVEVREMLGSILIVTTETVLIEFLNYFSEHGAEARLSAAETVAAIIDDTEIEYIRHDRETFSQAVKLYEKRPDKGYSLTDCISMLAMKRLGILEVLTHDDHFMQEGFTILF